jgi:hypothetical protein
MIPARFFRRILGIPWAAPGRPDRHRTHDGPIKTLPFTGFPRYCHIALAGSAMIRSAGKTS